MNLLRIGALLVIGGAAAAVTTPNSLWESTSKPLVEQDDAPKSIAESVSETLQFAEENFLTVAEAMPEDKYSFVPIAGKFDDVRSFGEQVKHVACSEFAFFNEFDGKKPPKVAKRAGTTRQKQREN
jgi:hypothetical protein